MGSTTNQPIPVVIVEGQALYRRGLRVVVEDAGLVIRAEYASTADAITAISDDGVLEPGTVAACSLTLDGWQEMVRLMLLQSPDLPILGLVDEITAEITIEALTRGLLACMERTLPLEQWVQTIRQAHEGTLALRDMVLSDPVVARYALTTLSEPATPPGLGTLAPVLAHRERLALSSVAEGVPLTQAGRQLDIPQQVLNEVLESACRKLVARHRLSAVLQRVR